MLGEIAHAGRERSESGYAHARRLVMEGRRLDDRDEPSQALDLNVCGPAPEENRPTNMG
jgi:hypothetical protein